MKIAVVTTSFLPRVGGAEFAVHHLAQQWVAAGHTVRVLNQIADTPTHPDARYSVERYATPPGAYRLGLHGHWTSFWVNRTLRSKLEVFGPDTISAHFGYPVGIWLARMKDLPPWIVTPHGPALNVTPEGPRARYGIDELVGASLAAARRAVAISTHAREVMESIGVPPEQIADIPNGVEAERFRRRVEGFDLAGQFGLDRDAVTVLSVGREAEAKDYRTGLEAFARAAARVPGLVYLLVGAGIGDVWKPVAEQLGIADRVRFHDGLFGDDLVATYQQADIFFLPSKKELCPLVVPEAMAAGCPAVVTDVSGSQDMIADGDNGFVAPPGDAAALGDALARLGEDAALRERMAARATELSARYDWVRIAAEHLELTGL